MLDRIVKVTKVWSSDKKIRYASDSFYLMYVKAICGVTLYTSAFSEYNIFKIMVLPQWWLLLKY